MTGPGPIALVGGGEHMPATASVDVRLMELTGVSRPSVVVLPLAAASRQRAKTAALARNHWTRIGASFSLALPDVDESAAAEAVASADIIVLPGGHPNKLVDALGASPIADLIVDLWIDGAAISGSSAGAMAAFEWRINLYPPNPLRVIPSLGLLDGYVAAPHFDRFKADRWSSRVLPIIRTLDILGLDESTGLVGHNNDFEVFGEGKVTVVNRQGIASYRPGDWVALDLLRGSERRLIEKSRSHDHQDKPVEPLFVSSRR